MRWKKFTESKYFFTVVCLSFSLLMTAILFLKPIGISNEKKIELWNQGKEAAARNDYAGAIQKLEEAIACIGYTIEESDFLLVEELMQMQIAANVLEGAIETCTRLIEAGEESAKFYITRGKLYNQMGQFSLCLSDYQSAIEEDPYNKEMYDRIVQQLEEQGYLNEAAVFRNTAAQFLEK